MALEPRPEAVPFDEAIAFLRDKLRLTSRGWTDVWQEQNAVAFTVAGAQSAQLVADFHQVVTKAIRDGTTLAEFREDFDAIVEQHGWSYRGSRGWRTRVIFETNLRTSYQAGRWDQAWRLRDDRPFLRYVAVQDDRTRPQHRQWHGTVLPIDADWWKTHYPPNGWGCRCTVQSLSRRDMARRGYQVTSPAPKPQLVERSVNTPDGQRTEMVPAGIDPGWAYNVGQARQSARIAQQAARDIGGMPADLGAAVGQNIAAATRSALAEDFRSWVADRAAASWRADGSWRALGALPARAVERMNQVGAPTESAGVAITSEQLRHLARDTKVEAGVAVSLADIQRLPELVNEPKAVLREIATGVILLVFEPAEDPRRGKLVMHLNYTHRLRDPDGERRTRRFHAVKTAGLVKAETLRDGKTYQLIHGVV